MVNLFKTEETDINYIVGESFKNTFQYKRYLERALFRAIETQTIFCPNCGTFEVNPKGYESPLLRFCTKCGNTGAFFAWTSSSIKSQKNIDILINKELVDTAKIVLMLTSIAKSHAVTINWYYQDGEFVRALA